MSVGIVTVTPGSPADRAGILPGERIDSIDGEPVLDEIDYHRTVRRFLLRNPERGLGHAVQEPCRR